MRGSSFRAPGPLRPEAEAAGKHDSADDACGFQQAVSSDRRSDLRHGISRMESLVSETGMPNADPGSLSDGRQRSSRAGRSHGGPLGSTGCGERTRGLRFDEHVPYNGYRWWYIDGLSDDGEYGITVIAFIGSVFSPYYAWTAKRDPRNHCAMNVALYGKVKRWAMTERGRDALHTNASTYVVGPSAMHWDGTGLSIKIDEVAFPRMAPIRGTIRLHMDATTAQSFALDGEMSHRWWPVAPYARIEVELERPDLKWSGHGYLDTNWGDEPLEDAFSRWDWLRARCGDNAVILYDVETHDGERRSLALRFDSVGRVQHVSPPPAAALPRTLWRVPRWTQSEDGSARVLKTLEDAPFYSRSIIETRLLGEQTKAFHESLSLDRFRTNWVKCLLPFRMPRTTARV